MKFGRNNGRTEGHGESSIAPLFQSGAIIKTQYLSKEIGVGVVIPC